MNSTRAHELRVDQKGQEYNLNAAIYLDPGYDIMLYHLDENPDCWIVISYYNPARHNALKLLPENLGSPFSV
ncbi:MAG: hypothetical protein GY777_00835 [Candidatus Brocadiaceae bacterium]|nr:hypothetical protein [Candidatus Brocadiaceae bacterium]